MRLHFSILQSKNIYFMQLHNKAHAFMNRLVFQLTLMNVSKLDVVRSSYLQTSSLLLDHKVVSLKLLLHDYLTFHQVYHR